MKYSTIIKYLRQTKFSPSSNNPENDEIIIDVLDEQPFASLKQIAQTAGIPKSTVHHHLTVILNFKSMNLKLFFRNLTNKQKANVY